MKQAFVWDMFKKASAVVVSSDPLSPTLINFLSYENSTRERNLMPLSQKRRRFQLEYTYNQLFSPNIGALTKNLGQCRHYQIIGNIQ
jgi:hypothetical protein